MEKVYVGMDVGSKSCTAVAINERGKRLDSEMFTTSAQFMIAFMQRQEGEVRVLIEEGEMAGWVMRTIKPYVTSITVCDPKRNAWVAKAGNKNDIVDAAKLAELNRLGSYSAVWHPQEEEIAAFKVVVQHFDECSRRLARTKCQIKARLRGQGAIVRGQLVYGTEGRLKALARVKSGSARKVIEQDYQLLDYLTKAKSEARGLLIEASKRYPVTRRLKEIPGVGPVTAARFVAYVGDPNRFNKRTIASYSCLGVVKRSSDGSPLGREHLSKAGNAVLKDVSRTVFERARATRRPNGIKEFCAESLRRTGSQTNARLNTQRKILAVMLAVWRDGTEYSDELVTGKAFTGA
jgi:transposase